MPGIKGRRWSLSNSEEGSPYLRGKLDAFILIYFDTRGFGADCLAVM